MALAAAVVLEVKQIPNKIDNKRFEKVFVVQAKNCVEELFFQMFNFL